MSDWPAIPTVCSTPGVSFAIASIRSISRCVRSTAAESGSWMLRSRYPLSCCGTNPVGVRVNSWYVRYKSPPYTASTKSDTRSKRPTAAAYHSATFSAEWFILPSSHASPRPTPPEMRANQPGGAGWCGSRFFSRIPARAGLSVSELNAEMRVDVAMVTANCRKNWPVTPPMNAQGMKTAVSTSAMAMTGPVTSSIARRVASFGSRPRSSQRSTFSTTTIASSTTIPMASTSPNSDRLFSENFSAAITANVPMMATGTAASGMIAARQLWRNKSTTSATRMTASRRVWNTSFTDCRMKGVVSYTTS